MADSPYQPPKGEGGVHDPTPWWGSAFEIAIKVAPFLAVVVILAILVWLTRTHAATLATR